MWFYFSDWKWIPEDTAVCHQLRWRYWYYSLNGWKYCRLGMFTIFSIIFHSLTQRCRSIGIDPSCWKSRLPKWISYIIPSYFLNLARQNIWFHQKLAVNVILISQAAHHHFSSAFTHFTSFHMTFLPSTCDAVLLAFFFYDQVSSHGQNFSL